MKHFLILLLFIFPSFLFSQDQLVLDSLEIKLQFSQHDNEKVNTLLEISKLYWKTDLTKSVDYSLQALEIAKQSRNTSLIASANYRLGGTFLLMGKLETGLQHYLTCLKLYEELSDIGKLIDTYQSIGVLYGNLEDYDKAQEFFFKAVSIYSEKFSEEERASYQKIYAVYGNIGKIYEVRSEDQAAIKYYLKAVEQAEAHKVYENLGGIYCNLAYSHLKLNQFKKAYKYAQKSLVIDQKIGNNRGVAHDYVVLGDYYLETKEYDKAIAVTQKSLEQAKEVGSLKIQQYAYQLLSLLYERTNLYDKSLEAYKLYKSVNDSLLNEQTIEKITQAKMQFEFDKKEKIRRAEQQKKDLKYGLLISILTLGFIITGLLFMLLKNRTKRITLQKKNLEQDLELKNKELTTNVMYLLKKNELMNSVTARLVDLKARLKGVNSDTIREIIFDMESNTDKDVWKEFEVRFHQVHDGFFKKVLDICPNLSPGDLKMCAFLKLNMSTKEIASIIHQSTKSIEVKRTRIRKKLNLTNKDINLISFLNEL